MAVAVATTKGLDIPGLGQALDKTSLERSSVTYNGLPNIVDQTQVQTEFAKSILGFLAIIERHAMGDRFRIHSAHRHDMLPAGTVRLEEDIGIKGIKWNRATAIDKVMAGEAHPMVFKCSEKAWIPVEFAEGPLPFAVDDIPAEFLAETATYVADNGLAEVLVLELGDFARVSGVTAEIEIHWGAVEAFTIVVPSYMLVKESFGDLIPTSWHVKASPIGPDSAPKDPGGKPDAGTTWAPVDKPKDTHKVFVSGLKSVTPDRLISTLIGMNYLLA